MTQPKFTELPAEVQVAIINAASQLAATQLNLRGKSYNLSADFFDIEYRKICNTLYKDNRGG